MVEDGEDEEENDTGEGDESTERESDMDEELMNIDDLLYSDEELF